MWWFRKKKREEKPEQGKVGEPYVLPADGTRATVGLNIIPLEPPEIEYTVSAKKGQKTYGSYEMRIFGEVKHAYKAEVFQGSACHIEINRFAGSEAEEYEARGCLGYMNLREDEKYFKVRLSIEDRYLSDIIKLIHEYEPEEDSIFLIILHIENERRFSEWPRNFPIKDGKRHITYEVVQLSCSHYTGEALVEPWSPEDSGE